MSVLNAYLGIASESSEEKVLRLLIELAAQFADAQEGSLLVLDEDKAELVFAMTIGSAASEKSLIGQRVPLGEGLVGLCAQTQEVQIGAPKFDVPGSKEREEGDKPKAVLAAFRACSDKSDVYGGHGGSHAYLAHEFVDAVAHERTPAINVWEAVRYMATSVMAHKSAMRDGEVLDVPDWGDAPE